MQFFYYVGIDVSKSTLDIAVRNQNQLLFHLQVANSKAGIRDFYQHCKTEKITLKKALFCLEHTGIYAHIILEQVFLKGYAIWLEQSLQIKKSLGMQRGKNDRLDAMRIAEYAYRFEDKVRLYQPKRTVVQQLTRLMQVRRSLLSSKKALSVSLKEKRGFEDSNMHKMAQKLMQPAIKKIIEQLQQVEKQIQVVIADDQRLSELFTIVSSVDGVGKVSTWHFIANTNEFKSIQDGRKYACYSGVVPFEHQSGSSIRGRRRVSPMANKSMKAILHMAVLTIIAAKKGELYEYYERKVKTGKHKMAIINALKNKIIQRVFACVKQGRVYEKDYQIKFA